MSFSQEGDGATITHDFVPHAFFDDINSCTITPNGRIAISCSADNTTRGVHLRGLRRKDTFIVPVRNIVAGSNIEQVTQVSASNNALATASLDGRVCFWKHNDFKDEIITKTCGDKKAFACSISRGTKYLISSFSDMKTSELFFTATKDGEDSYHVETDGIVIDLCVSGKTQRVFLLTLKKNTVKASFETSIQVWFPSSNKIETYYEFKNPINELMKNVPAMCADDDANRLFVADDESLQIFYPDGRMETLPNYKPSVGCKGLATTPDGDRIVASVAGNCFGVWDTRRKRRVATLRGHTDPAAECVRSSCAISDDGSTIVTGGLDKTVRVWSMAPQSKRGKTRSWVDIILNGLDTEDAEDAEDADDTENTEQTNEPKRRRVA